MIPGRSTYATLLSRALALCLLTASLRAQSPTPREERFRQFQRYLADRAATLTANNLAGITTAADWRRRRPEVRRELLYMLGLDPMPARTPLNARITGQFARAGYRVEKLVFESMPRLYVTANLYLPSPASGRLPAVLYLCGHSPDPAGAKAIYQQNGIRLARLGYVVLAVDPLEFGEVPGIHHGTHNLGMWYWLSLGYTPVGPEVWNAMRALDYLETRAEVAPGRFAVMGGSGGGSISWYAAAVDERIQVAAPRCATWTAGNQAAEDAVKENCDCIYFPNIYELDFPVLGALIAPRALDALNAIRDPMFPPGGFREADRQSRRIYDLLGAGERLAEFEQDVPHSDTPAFRKNGFEWINRWLKDGAAPYQESEVSPEDPASLAVLDRRPADAINDSIHKSFIPTHALKRWSSLEAWKARRRELGDQLKDKVFRAFPAASPATQAPFQVWKEKETGWTSRYADSWNVEYTTERGIRVSGRLFVPRGPARAWPALMDIRGAADCVYPVDYDFLLPALGNHVVLILEPRAVDYPADNFRMATLERTAAMVGATIESMQVWDILRSVDFLTSEENLQLSSVSLYGRKEMGALALYAAALDARISRVILDDPPSSHWQGPALLNILRVTDLPEVAAMTAPRDIVWLTPPAREYEYTASVYSLYGRRLRRADGLAAALEIGGVKQ
jgi:cephalosporin-C deacetylase-like acetyl esterase